MMDFRSGSPSDNSGAEEMEVSLAKPKHRVVRPPPPRAAQWGAARGRDAGPPEGRAPMRPLTPGTGPPPRRP